MNYEMLQKIFFTHPENASYLIEIFTHEKIHSMSPITIFELPDTSTVILFHDKHHIFICIFCEGILLKVDEMLLKVFEKSYNDIFHTCQKFDIKQLKIILFSQDYIFNDISKYHHVYQADSETQIDNLDFEMPLNEKLFHNIVINVIEIRKAYHYTTDAKIKNLSAIFIKESAVETNILIDEILYHMNPSNWDNQEMIKYYEIEARAQKILDTQRDAFTEGVKFGQHDGQVNTAYFIKGLLSEKHPDIEKFLIKLCYVKPDVKNKDRSHEFMA